MVQDSGTFTGSNPIQLQRESILSVLQRCLYGYRMGDGRGRRRSGTEDWRLLETKIVKVSI
jgi:hypothetical protein